MSEHTPAPWEWKDGHLYHEGERVLDFGCGCCTWGDPTDADKNLIAAAPDLLVALEYCRQKIAYMTTHGEWYSPGKAIEMADAAIAKARGEV